MWGRGRKSPLAAALGCAAALICTAAAANAQGGALDPGFGANGISITRIGAEGAINSLVLQADGKTLAVGSSEPCYYGCNPELTLARFTTSGSLDPSFGHDGIVATPIGTWSVGEAVQLQSDGKVVVAGVADLGTQNPASVFMLARYLSNGSLDPSFGNQGVVTTPVGFRKGWDSARALVIQSDGKIVVTGESLTQPDGQSEIVVARYNPDGSLDATFGSGGTVVTASEGGDDHGQAVLIEPDGKIVVGASSGAPGVVLARYLVTGARTPVSASTAPS